MRYRWNPWIKTSSVQTPNLVYGLMMSAWAALSLCAILLDPAIATCSYIYFNFCSLLSLRAMQRIFKFSSKRSKLERRSSLTTPLLRAEARRETALVLKEVRDNLGSTTNQFYTWYWTHHANDAHFYHWFLWVWLTLSAATDSQLEPGHLPSLL